MKKRVFIFIHQCILKGGVEKVFCNLLNNLPMDKYDITVLSVMGYLTDDFDARIYPKQVKRHCLMWDEFSKTNPIKRVIQKIHNRIFPMAYKAFLKYINFDVAIAAQEGVYADFVKNKVRAKRKLLWIHNDIEKCHWSLQHYETIDAERDCYSSFDKVVCVSNSVAESMNRVFGRMVNLCICYNPVDTFEIDCKLKEKFPERPNEYPWFVCVGRLVHQKGYDRLLEICYRLNKEGYKYNISILGEGEDRLKLERIIIDYGMVNIHLLGNKSNPYVYIKQADWLLLPSRHEGFGMVLHEAAYCRTPIIATDVCGASELLGESEYGLVVENSVDGLYAVLKRVLDLPAIHKHYKESITKRSDFIDLKQRIGAIQSIIDA